MGLRMIYRGGENVKLDDLSRARSRSVGTKQTSKAVEKGKARAVFLAGDAERHVTGPLEELCREHQVPVVEVPSMRELGAACGIQVGAASAAILKED